MDKITLSRSGLMQKLKVQAAKGAETEGGPTGFSTTVWAFKLDSVEGYTLLCSEPNSGEGYTFAMEAKAAK